MRISGRTRASASLQFYWERYIRISWLLREQGSRWSVVSVASAAKRQLGCRTPKIVGACCLCFVVLIFGETCSHKLAAAGAGLPLERCECGLVGKAAAGLPFGAQGKPHSKNARKSMEVVL